MTEASNLEIMQRINAMLENSLDLSNLTGDVAPKRNYSGRFCAHYLSCIVLHVFMVLDSLSMSDLFAGFGNNVNNGGMSSQQDDVLTSLLQQHQLSQALKQHQLEQQREQSQIKSLNSSLFNSKARSVMLH